MTSKRVLMILFVLFRQFRAALYCHSPLGSKITGDSVNVRSDPRVFHVKHFPLGLFANAEIRKDHVQQILDIDPPGHATKRAHCHAKVFCNEFRVTAPAGQCGIHVRQALLQRGTVPLPCNKGVSASLEDAGRHARYRIDQL